MELQKAHGIVTMAYGPLSPLLRHPSKGGPLKPILARIGERLGLEPASVLLLWFKAKGVVPVTSTTKAERLAAMGELARSEASLTADEVAEIDAVGRKIHYRAYDHHMMFDHHKTDLPVDL
jgi:diketogulonate reductase-like aldo/keto reductase